MAKFSIDERQDVVEPSLDSEMVAESTASINISALAQQLSMEIND